MDRTPRAEPWKGCRISSLGVGLKVTNEVTGRHCYTSRTPISWLKSYRLDDYSYEANLRGFLRLWSTEDTTRVQIHICVIGQRGRQAPGTSTCLQGALLPCVGASLHQAPMSGPLPRSPDAPASSVAWRLLPLMCPHASRHPPSTLWTAPAGIHCPAPWPRDTGLLWGLHGQTPGSRDPLGLRQEG